MDKVLQKLQKEISKKRKGKQSDYLQSLINELIEEGFEGVPDIEKKYHCKIYTRNQKHNELQFTFYYQITSDLIKGELYLEVEDGIDNGTQLNEYSFTKRLDNKKYSFQVIKDVVLDESKYVKGSFFHRKSKHILDSNKLLILEYIQRHNYDNYITGGNSKMKPTGAWSDLNLVFVYDEIEIKPSFVI